MWKYTDHQLRVKLAMSNMAIEAIFDTIPVNSADLLKCCEHKILICEEIVSRESWLYNFVTKIRRSIYNAYASSTL